MKQFGISSNFAAVLLALGIAAGCATIRGRSSAAVRGQPSPALRTILGQSKIVAWPYYSGDAKALRSPTLIHSSPAEREYWATRHVVPATAKTWQSILTDTTVEQGVAEILKLNFSGAPQPVVCLDEFGFDYGGETDRKTAAILREVKKRKPELALCVYQMRGPYPDVLARIYRKAVDLVMMEAYVGDKAQYWHLMTQVEAARLNGLLNRSIVLLGLGVGGQPGENWISSAAELEQQIRFVRFIAPESPGIGFFTGKVDPGVLARADELCQRFDDIPTDGSGLPDDVQELYRPFAARHERPFLVCAPNLVEPNRTWANPHALVRPITFRVCLLNLGAKDARGVAIRLRNPKDKGGDIFAAGKIRNLPARKVSVAVLPVTQPGSPWKVWKTWEMEVDAPDCDVLQFR
jgi:hypothetical protein